MKIYLQLFDDYWNSEKKKFDEAVKSGDKAAAQTALNTKIEGVEINGVSVVTNKIANIDLNHNHARSSNSCKECFNDLLAQLIRVPDLPDEVCRNTIVEIYYEQAVFNSPIWSVMNQKLYSQLNS